MNSFYTFYTVLVNICQSIKVGYIAWNISVTYLVYKMFSDDDFCIVTQVTCHISITLSRDHKHTYELLWQVR